MATTTLTVVPLPASTHPGPSDAAGDLLAVAWAPGVAPPREIAVRPELYERLGVQLGWHGTGPRSLGEPAGVPVVVDPRLPASPGFEVRRVRPVVRRWSGAAAA
ncbi:hypothetical protein ACI8AA_04185 [Geodermatophilus sp. SYSU D01180]